MMPAWLNPSKVLIYILFPIYIYASWQDYSVYRVSRYIDSNYYYGGLCLLLIILLGAIAGSMLPDRYRGRSIYDYSYGSLSKFLKLFFWAFFFLSILGYTIWFWDLFINPKMIVDFILQGKMNVRGDISTIPGLTTLTQFGPLFSVMAALLFGLKANNSTIYKFAYILFLFFVFLRALVWSERLALIEVLIPFIVVYYIFVDKEKRVYWFYKRGFLFLVFFIFIIFGFFEYFRSWNFYRDQYDNYFIFILERLAAYYTLSINNGIGFLEEYKDWPLMTGESLFGFIYRIPFFDWDSYSSRYFLYTDFLDSHLRAEFNNGTAIFSIVSDVGFPIAGILYFLYGIFLGVSYGGFKRKSLMFSVIYPFALISLYEIFRFSFFSVSRSTYIVFGLFLLGIVGSMLLRKKRKGFEDMTILKRDNRSYTEILPEAGEEAITPY